MREADVTTVMCWRLWNLGA